MNYAVIMAGGAGTRLWPLSRRGMPKQLLPLINGRSLLQLAFDRASTVIDPSRIIVCAGRTYRDVILEQLPKLDQKNLLSEPVGRDSLAAIAWSVATIASRDPEATVAILSADHVIEPQTAFSATLESAVAVAANDDQALVTFGVVPTRPHTGYGYLHLGEPVSGVAGVFEVSRFAEKPTAEVAASYLAEGGWWWNSGMFCWRAATFLAVLHQLQAPMAAAIDRLVGDPELIDQIYPTLTKISVDFAIMEPVSHHLTPAHVLAVGLRATWADVGDFPSLAAQMGNQDGNATVGQVVALDSHGNLIWNADDERVIAVSGLEDMIVVHDGNVTLVCPMGEAQTIKQLAELARDRGDLYA